jgi:hypothetical protein
MLSLVWIIQNNFVFVPICPIADLADASEVFPAQPAAQMSLFSLLFLMVLISVDANLWCRKWAVVLWQEMKTGLSRLEPTATAPSVFVRHWRSSAKKPQDASSGQLSLKTPLKPTSCENQASSWGNANPSYSLDRQMAKRVQK